MAKIIELEIKNFRGIKNFKENFDQRLVCFVARGDSGKSTILEAISMALSPSVATNRYRQYQKAGLDWIGRAVIAEALFDLGEKEDYRVILNSTFPQEVKVIIADPSKGSSYEVVCESRKMGQDNGKN